MNIKDIEMKPFSILDEEWALVTAGSKDKFNAMTISWGSFGMIWYKPVISIYIRKTRYTFDFIEKNDYFTVSFYPSQYKDDLKVLGSKSGRDCDKLSEVGLIPLFIKNDVITFKEASTSYICKKLHIQEIDEPNRENKNDNHMLIIAEVIEVKQSEKGE